MLGLVLCAFSTAWGCVCGIRHIRLDWDNEIEVIKQGADVAIYMLPNMFVVMGLTVLVVFLGTRIAGYGGLLERRNSSLSSVGRD